MAFNRKTLAYDLWRTAVFRRDKFICQMCKKKGRRLQAHHIKMVSQHPWYALDVGNGITLCNSCHASIRHKEKAWEQIFFAITKGLRVNPLVIAKISAPMLFLCGE